MAIWTIFRRSKAAIRGVKLTKREVAMSPYKIKMTMAMHAGELPRWLSKKIIKDAGLTEDA